MKKINAAMRLIDKAVDTYERMCTSIFAYIKSRHDRVLKQVCVMVMRWLLFMWLCV